MPSLHPDLEEVVSINQVLCELAAFWVQTCITWEVDVEGDAGKDIPPRWTVSEGDPFYGNGPVYEDEGILAKVP